MIRRMTVSDIIQINNLSDEGFTDRFQCDKGEWIQYLIQNVDNDLFFMICSLKDNNLIGYMIATHVEIAVYKGISVLYSRTAGLSNNKNALQQLISWGKTRGVKKIEITTSNPIGHSVYGFKKKGVTMELSI